MSGVFRLRDFRLLVAGEGVSLLGDQFALIALPWLVLQVTGSALVLGTVLAIQGIPRALFMLVGGAVTDRFSPRDVMLGANTARCLAVAALAVAALSGVVSVWMLYAYAIAFGLADGFFYPAQNAIVPQIAGGERLERANAVVQGLEQVALFVAPVLAGVLIAQLSGGAGGAGDLTGVGAALAIDAGTFIVSLVTLSLIGVRRYVSAAPGEATDGSSNDARGAATGATPVAATGADGGGGLLAAIRAGLRYMWDDQTLRVLFIIIVAVNFLVIGPLLVGIPVIAAQRLSDGTGGSGAESYGIVMSVFGGASLLGIALAGLLPRPPARLTGPLLVALCAVFAVAMGLLGYAATVFRVAAPVFAMGAASGYLVVFFFSWLQRRTPPEMMGRMMSLILFASVGLVPVSQALSGALIKADTTALFVGTAMVLGTLLVAAALSPGLRAMGAEMAGGPQAGESQHG